MAQPWVQICLIWACKEKVDKKSESAFSSELHPVSECLLCDLEPCHSVLLLISLEIPAVQISVCSRSTLITDWTTKVSSQGKCGSWLVWELSRADCVSVTLFKNWRVLAVAPRSWIFRWQDQPTYTCCQSPKEDHLDNNVSCSQA